MSTKPVYVVVCSYGASPSYLKEDGTRYGPIVMETDVDSASKQQAEQRAALLKNDYGPCRIGRVVFEGEPGFSIEGDQQ